MGGAVGGALGAVVIVLIVILVWRHKKGARTPPSAGQQPSPQPVTPTFSTNSNYTGGPPLTYAAPAVWHPQQPAVFTPPQDVGSSVSGQTSPPSRQSAPSPYGRPNTIHQANYGGSTSQPHVSHSTEGSVGPRESYSDAPQGSSIPPMSAPSPAPAYSFIPPVSEKTGH